MIDKKLSRLEQLEQDIWLNFCYYYQCELDNELIETENQSYIDQKEKIIKRMQQNDFPLSEQSAFHLEMMGDVVSIPFKPFQIAQLLMQINTLRLEVNNLPAKIFQRQYSDILIAYVQMLGGGGVYSEQYTCQKCKGNHCSQSSLRQAFISKTGNFISHFKRAGGASWQMG